MIKNNKIKNLRPLSIAISFVFAIGAGFTSVTQQKGWYKDDSEVLDMGTLGTITNPIDTNINPCVTQIGIICLVNCSFAYDSKMDAEAGNTIGLLRYSTE